MPFREVLSNAPIDVFRVDETKLDSSFPDHQFKIEGYHFPPSGEIETQSVRKLVYLREDFIAKRIPKLETEKAETFSIEINIVKKTWCILFHLLSSKFLEI